eukprot:715238_1
MNGPATHRVIPITETLQTTPRNVAMHPTVSAPKNTPLKARIELSIAVPIFDPDSLTAKIGSKTACGNPKISGNFIARKVASAATTALRNAHPIFRGKSLR